MAPGVPDRRGGHTRAAVHLLTAWLLGAAACVSAPPSGAPPPGGPAAPAATTAPARSAAVALGSAQGSFTFAVIGDNGTGDAGQYDTGRQLFAAYQRQAFPLVIMVGDNIYGSERPQDFVRKFEAPYRPLLDAGVKFYASLGNHDSREQRYYKPYNMEGKLYYSLTSPEQDVRFFALDSTYLDKPQVEWLEKELSGSKERWKIPFFHHPPYRPGAGMARTCVSAQPWSRCSSSTASPSSSPATITSTSARGRNRGSRIS